MGLGDGKLLRADPDARERQREADRLRRHAQAWAFAGRPDRMLLRGDRLRAAEALVRELDAREAWAGHAPRVDPQAPAPGELERALVVASRAARRRLAQWSALALTMAGLLVASFLWPGPAPAPSSSRRAPEQPPPPSADAMVEAVPEAPPATRTNSPKQTLEHTVIPAETLEEIALRYDVPIPSISRWNGIGEHDELIPGQTLRITTSKLPLPLPRQMLVYRPERHESWSSVAQRFDVSVAKLRAYNPEIDGEPGAGAELVVYVDPKPLVRKRDVQIPEFEVRPDAISVGSPRNGRLIDGIQFPADDSLYKRRKPYIMWCSSHMAKHLREAIAAFRYTYEFEGELVVADMSQRGGGRFPPHKSHQAGRDVDIWLPTLKGVYQRNRLERDVRPNPEEADWFALYGFLQALHATGEVQQVFLAYELHERVYQAAKLMGASDDELDAMIAYPRGRHYRKSLLQHSDGHTHHIHVRFECGPHDQCSAGADEDAGD